MTNTYDELAGLNGTSLSRRQLLTRALALGVSLPVGIKMLGFDDVALAALAAGGTLTVGFNEDIANLDPHLQGGVTDTVIEHNIWEALTDWDPLTGQVLPSLATSWKALGPQAVQFTLRDNVKFHSGASLTSQDVVFTIARIKNPKTASFYAANIASIESIDAVSPTEFIVKLNTPVALGALIDIFRDILIVSAADGASVGTKPDGTGPFKFVKWELHNQIQLTKNTSYWNPSLPSVDNVVVKIIPDPQSSIAALEANDIDVLATPPLADLLQIGSSSSISILQAKVPDQIDVIEINRSKPPFDNVHLRRTIMYAFDRDTYWKLFLGGHGTPQTTPL